MRIGIFGGIVASLSAWAPAHAQTSFERQVLEALNTARSNPAAYAQQLREYRGYFHANLLHYPGQSVDIQTQEGVVVVDETIGFLGHQPALQPVMEGVMLEENAASQVADQARHGGEGHLGSDGSTPAERMRRRGGGTYVAEVIAYGPLDPTDVVRQLIVDDGVADRGHRSIIYSGELRFAGVACGPHPEYRTVCVIDLGVTPDGRQTSGGGAIRLAAR
jgi:uncharacterized protein YkwD